TARAHGPSRRGRPGPAACHLPPALLRPGGGPHPRARLPEAHRRDRARAGRRPGPVDRGGRPGVPEPGPHDPQAPGPDRPRPRRRHRPHGPGRGGGAARPHRGAPVIHPHEPWWISVIKVLVIINLVMAAFAYTTWLERKVLGRMQLRYGPNRAGPFGLLQPIADLIKLVRKEAFYPD